MSSLTTATVDDFDTVLGSTKNPVVVYFYADWCTPCQLFTPSIEKMIEKFSNLKFVGVNVDQSKEIRSRYGIEFVPACVVLFEGNILHIIYGAKSDAVECILSQINLDYC